MKKAFVLLTALVISLAALAEERQVSYTKLPEKAKEFISNNFSTLKVTYVKYDRELSDRDYEVHFANGTTIEFNHKGEWKQIDCGRGCEVPLSILPQGIVDFLSAEYPGVAVVDVDKDRREYDITLSNGVELTFDKHGGFKYYEYDD